MTNKTSQQDAAQLPLKMRPGEATAARRRVKTSITTLDGLGRRRGAAVFLEVLRSEGARYIFGNPGTTELFLVDALVDAPDISYVWALQEASAVAMADGYAQASGRPGVLNLHTTGGLGHGLGNLLNASVSGTPLVVTAGQQDSRHTVTDPLLFGDLTGIASPAVKWAKEVGHADQIPTLVRRAFHDCNAAPSGPVFLSLPMDVMEQMTTVDIGEVSVIDRAPVAGSLDRLADYLTAVTPGKLAIIAGDEVSASNAAAETVRLADALAAPVYGSSWPAHIAFPTAHPLWRGNLPIKANEIARELKRYDAIFALGGKSLITILYTEGSAVPSGVDLFQLSADVRWLGRTYPTKLSMVGDIGVSLTALLSLLAPKIAGRADIYAALRERAAQDREARRAQLIATADSELAGPVITPLVAGREMARAIGPDIAIVDEAAATMGHLRAFLITSSSRQYFFSRGGALGWGMPAAVGFSLGINREPVVSIVGDGAALYSPQALWTAAYEKLPVTFVVINNREYNMLKRFVKSQPHSSSVRANRFIAMDIVDPAIDFHALAASMGVPARRVDRASDIAPAIEAGIASGAANLVEIPVGAT
jgi:benzoylformate decarboxylase